MQFVTPTQAKKNARIIYKNREEPLTSKGSLDGLQSSQNQCDKSKVKISLWQRKSYHRTDIEEIRLRFYQIRPVVSHLEVYLTDKHLTPKNIGEALKFPQRNFWKENVFVKNYKNENANLLSAPTPVK